MTPARPTPVATTRAAPAVAAEPQNAQTVARHLAADETAIRSPSTPEAEAVAAGADQQRAYDALAAHPDWEDAVVAAMPDALRDTVRSNVAAGADLGELDAPSSPSNRLPDWRIVTPPPPATLLSYYHEGEAAYGVPWPYLAAINLVETRMGRIVGDSAAGARGPMQFIAGTWAEFGSGSIDDPHDSILAAARYLAASGAPGDMGVALLAYNDSTLYVDAVSRYAAVMRADARAYLGYYGWQVMVSTAHGTVVLPEGYGAPTPPARLRRNP